MNDSDFLLWIYNRLVNVHNENPNVDYMRRLKEIIDGAKAVEKMEDLPYFLKREGL